MMHISFPPFFSMCICNGFIKRMILVEFMNLGAFTVGISITFWLLCLIEWFHCCSNMEVSASKVVLILLVLLYHY